VIDLQLVGYTADLRHLVFDLDGGSGEGRYRLLIDPDLFATIDTIRDGRREEGLQVGDDTEYEWEDGWEDEGEWEEVEWAEEPMDEDPAPGAWLGDDEDDTVAGDSFDTEPDAETDDASEDASEDAAGSGEDLEDLDDLAFLDETSTHVVAADEPEADPAAEIRARAARPGLDARTGEGPTLSPLEIQALLRAGRSVRSVAKAAGTTVEWVDNWLGPIEAEREQILRAARRLRLERARLGRSREAMGVAVDRNLRNRGVGTDDVTWEAVRRKDGRWRVSASFAHRRRRTKASWLYDPAAGTLEAANDDGNELGFVRRKQRA